MFQFQSVKDEEKIYPGGKIANISLFSEYNEVKLYGILRKLFGEPVYETDDYENAYEYIIKAEDQVAGITLYFSVYQGPTGCAVGAVKSSKDMSRAMDEFIDLLKAAKPADYMYEGIYSDGCVKLRYGIQDGQVLFEEIDLEDDEDEAEQEKSVQEKVNQEKNNHKNVEQAKDEFKLRDLTDDEKQELARFKLSDQEDSLHVLLSMALIDLVPDEISDRPVTTEDIKRYCYMGNKDFCGYPLDREIIEQWLIKVFRDNNKEINKANFNKIFGLTYNLTDTLFRISGGMTGKYQRKMLHAFQKINENLKLQKGREIYDLAYESYQYIMWCLEYMGVTRKPSVGKKIVDTSNLTGWDIW